MEDKTKEFLTELQALLEKYDATIGWGCAEGSDMEGIFDDHIYIDIGMHEVYTSKYGEIDKSRLIEFKQ